MNPLEILNTEKHRLDTNYEKLEGLTPIMYAAKYGLGTYIDKNLSGLDDVLKSQILAKTNVGGLTALHFAARYGQLKETELLLKHGASPFIHSKLGQLPIHSAFTQNKDLQSMKEIFNRLSVYKQTLSLANNYGDTVAHFAAERGLVDVLTTLHSIDADLLNKKNGHGRTPLLTAISSNQAEATRYLLGIGDKTITDNRGRNALHYATLYGSTEVFSMVLPCIPVNHCDNEKYTALQYATDNKQQDKISLLLNAGALTHTVREGP